MILSHSNRFIFIKTRKTAGTSVQYALSQHCSGTDIVTEIEPERPGYCARNGNGWHTHATAASVKRRIPANIWDGYFKFAFERNPWDKVVSFFFWNFRTVLPSVSEQEKRKRFRIWLHRNTDKVRDYSAYTIGGDLAVDFLGQYEYLNRDYRHVLSRVGLPYESLPKLKGGARKDKAYRKYFTKSLKDLVGDVYADEIRLLGYTF